MKKLLFLLFILLLSGYVTDVHAVSVPSLPTATTKTPSAPTIAFCPSDAPGQSQTRPYRMLYLQSGSLYLQDENQEARLLRSSGAIKYFMHLPGNHTVFYIQVDRYGRDELWSVTLDGRAIRLAGPPYVNGLILPGPVSPDGARVAFSLMPNDSNGEVWIANANGTGAWRVVSAADLRALLSERYPSDVGVEPTGLIWMRDSRILLYTVYPLTGGLFVYTPDLHAVNILSVRKVDSPFPIPPNYSPNQQLAALTFPNGLTFSGADGRDPRPAAVNYFAIGIGKTLFYPPMQWLPDSSGVLLAQIRRGEYTFPKTSPVDIWRVPADGSPAQTLAAFNADVASVGFSPDLSLVHYWIAESPSNQRELHITQLPARRGEPAADIIYDRQPFLEMVGWSPDGRAFLYQIGDDADRALMLGELCSDPRELARGAFNLLTWIDSQRFVIVQSDAARQKFSYFTANLDGEIRPLFSQPLDKPYLDIWIP